MFQSNLNKHYILASIKAKQDSRTFAFSNLSKSLEYERHLKTVAAYGLLHGLSPDLIHTVITVVSLNKWRTSQENV